MATPARKQTKSTQIFQRLRHDLLHGAFAPGMKLQMDDLKERYQVGYSPLREALFRLVSNGLVQFEEQCGFSVPELSIEELYDIYQNRMRIENTALELAMEHGDDLWEAEVIACWYRYAKFMKSNEVLDPQIWESMEKVLP
jgi:GntR family carbon starvation induced transcriptional regulator